MMSVDVEGKVQLRLEVLFGACGEHQLVTIADCCSISMGKFCHSPAQRPVPLHVLLLLLSSFHMRLANGIWPTGSVWFTPSEDI